MTNLAPLAPQRWHVSRTDKRVDPPVLSMRPCLAKISNTPDSALVWTAKYRRQQYSRYGWVSLRVLVPLLCTYWAIWYCDQSPHPHDFDASLFGDRRKPPRIMAIHCCYGDLHRESDCNFRNSKILHYKLLVVDEYTWKHPWLNTCSDIAY